MRGEEYRKKIKKSYKMRPTLGMNPKAHTQGGGGPTLLLDPNFQTFFKTDPYPNVSKIQIRSLLISKIGNSNLEKSSRWKVDQKRFEKIQTYGDRVLDEDRNLSKEI